MSSKFTQLERKRRNNFVSVMHETLREMEPGVVPDASRARQLGHKVQQAAVWEIMKEHEIDFFKIHVLNYAGWLMETFRGSSKAPVIDITDDCHLAVFQGCDMVKDMAMRCMQFNDQYIWLEDVEALSERGFLGLMSPFLGHSPETDNVIMWLRDRIDCIH